MLLVGTKKLIYRYGIDADLISRGLKDTFYDFSEKKADIYRDIPEADKQIKQIFDYEFHRITYRIQDILSHQPYIGEDSLAAQAVPFVMEQRLDGSFLGLSTNLSADAFVFSEPMIIDLKFGPKEDFHRLYTTGYALVMEAIYEYPINIGCIVYGKFKNERLHVEKDFHIINDELRQWFIEERDEKMRMIYDGIDPGKADNCYETCPYFACCY